ncbi:MAG: PSD1 and planctomycete cytochrome C domain-containing protein [Prosthecobacter sp.]|uniref:PSD1 and planctomycete cytochrome C domain-containing protein n=1 Tax=Prosthecobacter sp. TaxID=1965333 RepID=UPI00262329E9|nr:PSD1 and planctomycete cytochrome C domain-containing protein [Prosthecobacter sp.]MCF7790179.1 PSD1 and planctomycete cytochrome C domain-containing protein [Prosthecobacter sp.]
MTRRPHTHLALVLLAAAPAWAAAAPVMFEKDVRPILKTHCFQCHGEEGEMKGGLDVRLARFILKGGKDGPVIVPGKVAESHLLDLVKKGDMPKGKTKLKDQDIATLEAWVAQGAKTARPEPEKLGPEHAFTDEERAWWSLQPIAKPVVPSLKFQVSSSQSALQGTNLKPSTLNLQLGIDAFIAAKLTEKGLSFSPEADPVTFIRRASFDLIGLPPTPAEVDEFVAAYIKHPESSIQNLVDRLLASPHYGERWGRHWLDTAGYADSEGFGERDLERPWSWKYRDYVINAFNKDKPFDQFVREQLAGDEMVPMPYKDLAPDAIEKLAATGFLRMSPNGTGEKNDAATQNANIADTLKMVGTSLYGLTIGCAQCHDHRYDPISQADYYRLRAVFEPGFDTKAWRAPGGRLVSLLTEKEIAESAKIEAEAKKLDTVRLAKAEEFITEVLEKELAKAPEADRAPLRTAYRTEVKKRTADQTKLLKAWPRVNQLSSGSLYLYDTTNKTKHADTLKKMAAEAADVRATKPKQEYLHAFTELPKKPGAVPATFIFNRGQFDQPKEQVKPSDLTVLASFRKIEIPEKDPALPTTGRRLALAKELTDGKHPLVARVMVNRVWMHHFGKGIVASPGDFGLLGSLPTHPELLDWLATDFMARGWSLKQLHRQIMTSRTYRQTSTRDATRDQIDPDNNYLSRMNVRRLEAEILRDSLLAVSGKLNPQVGGAPVPVMFNEEGQVVIGIDTTDTAGRPSGKIVPLNGAEFRRSIYVQARRSRQLEMFATFDAPIMEPSCDIRSVTTVSPQSLLLMNSTTMRVHAQQFAQRVQSEGGKDTADQIRYAFKLVSGKAPSESDVLQSVEFVQAQTEYYKANPTPLEVQLGAASKTPGDPAFLGLTALCHALLSSNALLYVD